MRALYLLLFMMTTNQLASRENPLRVGIAGLTHTHVHWIFGSESRNDIKIVGIVETNTALAHRYADQYGFSMEIVYPDLETLIAETQPEAVCAFGSIYEHLHVVQICAPKGIHVMVEKPLAVNLKHAKKIHKLAQKHNIHVLTNYETTWYPTTHETKALIASNKIGAIRKIVVRDGHKGPKKIGVDKEFLEWLTDPKLNGGGAIIDFGCYGANILTWLMEGRRPLTVTALTTQLQAENNPKVNDEAIILLDYGETVAVIHGSWNWPIGRKDMAVYGLDGVIYADNRNDLRVRIAEGYDDYAEEAVSLDERDPPFDDPFALLAAVLNDEVSLPPYDLSRLENNMIVMEILDAAIRSAKKNKTIKLD